MKYTHINSVRPNSLHKLGRRVDLNKSGFTLIEVVLVLAIGGLIFLLAFLAFQQVQTNRRDTQRRADLNRVVAELQNYYSDTRSYPVASVNDGNVCTGTDTNQFSVFLRTYVCVDKDGTKKFTSPSETDYIANLPTATPQVNRIRYRPNLGCDGTSAAFRVEMVLEGGKIACRDS